MQKKILSKDMMFKLRAYFSKRLGAYEYNNKGWLRADCPGCNSKTTFGINLLWNITNCFKCSYNESPILLVSKLENFRTVKEAWDFIGVSKDYTVFNTYVEELITKAKDIELPESYKLITLGQNRVGDIARKYMEQRGFSLRELALQGVGYCSRGSYKFRIIFPFYANGQLVYYMGRQFIDIGVKVKNPPLDIVGIGKSMIIYNIDCLKYYPKVYIVESVTNALTLGNNAIAILGKIASDYQVALMLKSKVKEFIIILDDDAIDYAIQLAFKLINEKRVRLIRMPKGKDVNDLGKEATIKRVKKEKSLTHNELLNLKIEHNAST